MKQEASNRATKLSETSATQVSPAVRARETWREAVSDDFGGESAESGGVSMASLGLRRYHLL